MAKEIAGYVKLQCKGGQANPFEPNAGPMGGEGLAWPPLH